MASNPEFLRAACSREDYLMPWMTVIGARSARTVERLSALYADFGGEIRTFTKPAEAEFVKCAHNLYNATKISFWNEMWQVASHADVELDTVAATVAVSAEASFNPEYGVRGGRPYGGACLPKDTRGFLGFAEDLGVDMPLLRGVISVNEGLEAIAAQAAMHEPAAAPASNGHLAGTGGRLT
jgi:UDPglucose 6-dehydrogenase